MRIFEIITPVEKDVKTNIDQVRMPGEDPNRRGLTAFVQDLKSDPHYLLRRDRAPGPEFDSYNEWITACMPYMSSNPYLPRVIKAIKRVGPDGNIRRDYQIEKLISFDELQETVDNEEYVKDMLSGIVFRIFGIQKQMSWIYLCDKIADLTINKDYSSIKDKKLVQALTLLNKVHDDINARGWSTSYDMHDGNFMLRRTGSLLQMVITDPLF